MKPHPFGVRLFLFMAIRVQYLSMKNEYVCVSLRRRWSLADEADFIARRSQLTLPTKTTSLADEDGFIFGGCLYVLQTLAAHGVMECRGGTILGVLVGKIDEVVGKVDVEVGGLWIQL